MREFAECCLTRVKSELGTAFKILAGERGQKRLYKHQVQVDALSRRLTILHGYGLGIAHLSLGTTLHTICRHFSPSFRADSHLRSETMTLRISLWPGSQREAGQSHQARDTASRIRMRCHRIHRHISTLNLKGELPYSAMSWSKTRIPMLSCSAKSVKKDSA